MKSIKNLSDDFKGMGTGGYLVVPRNLLGRVLDTGTPFTPAQAYMYLRPCYPEVKSAGL